MQDGGDNDCFSSLELELRGDHLLNKLSLVMSHSSSNNGVQDSALSSSHPSFTHQIRPVTADVTVREVTADAAVPSQVSNSSSVLTSPPSPTTSTRTLSSDDLYAKGQLLFPQQQHYQMPTTAIASHSSDLEPLDFRQSNSINSSSLLDLLQDGNGAVSADESANARTTENVEFPSKRQEQTMLQDRLRQLGQSQMQQFLMQQFGQQSVSMLQQQQQRQRLPTDGIFSFQDLNTNSSSVQTTPSNQNLGNSSVNLPSEEKRSYIISHSNKSNTIDKQKSSKRSRAASSSFFDKGSIQGSKSRARIDTEPPPSLSQVNTAPREPKAGKAEKRVKKIKKTNDSTFQYIKVVGGGLKRVLDKPVTSPKSRTSIELGSLHDYLDSTLKSRGYVTSKCSASELGYIKTPTPLQIASFDTAVCSANKPDDADQLRSILQCGLSAVPMNKFGDSPFFIACKRGVTELVKVFIGCGAEVRIADNFGRTPLHHAAWTSPLNFDTAKIILSADPCLLYVMDKHGKTPLDFVPKQYYLSWTKFIDSMAESLWPADADAKQCHPKPSKGALPDPANALEIKLAEDVASGKTKPLNR